MNAAKGPFGKGETLDDPNSTSFLEAAEMPEVLKQLAEGLSAHAQAANRLWLAVIVVAFVVIYPPKIDDHGYQPLPFDLATVPANQFGPVGCAVLGAITIAFCSASLHTMNGSKLAQDVIEGMTDKCRIRKTYDAVRASGVNRVWPIVQAIPECCPPLRKIAYVLLKSSASLIYVGVPWAAQFEAINRVCAADVGLLGLAALGIGGMSLLQLSILGILECGYIWRILRLPTSGGCSFACLRRFRLFRFCGLRDVPTNR